MKTHSIIITLALRVCFYAWGGESDLLWDDLRGAWEGLEFRPEITLLCVYQKFNSYKLEMQVIQ